MSLLSGAARIAHLREARESVIRTIENIKTVSFPGKETLLNDFEKLGASLAAIKENAEKTIDSIDRKITQAGNLTRKEFQALRFEEGFAVRELEKDGRTFYEFRNANGKKVFEEYVHASHFKDGKAAVTQIVNGKEENFFIDTAGRKVSESIEASFGSMQRF